LVYVWSRQIKGRRLEPGNKWGFYWGIYQSLKERREKEKRNYSETLWLINQFFFVDAAYRSEYGRRSVRFQLRRRINKGFNHVRIEQGVRLFTPDQKGKSHLRFYFIFCLSFPPVSIYNSMLIRTESKTPYVFFFVFFLFCVK
jgi:hypothetical protein